MEKRWEISKERMKVFPFINSNQAITILRIVVAFLLVAHGVAGIYKGTVNDFGGFLGARGFPVGIVLAWILTLVEIACGLLLAAGWLVRWLCLWFILELIMGIILVHAQHGWFVVGPGLNGVEYSVLLVCALWAIAALHKRKSFLKAV